MTVVGIWQKISSTQSFLSFLDYAIDFLISDFDSSNMSNSSPEMSQKNHLLPIHRSNQRCLNLKGERRWTSKRSVHFVFLKDKIDATSRTDPIRPKNICRPYTASLSWNRISLQLIILLQLKDFAKPFSPWDPHWALWN